MSTALFAAFTLAASVAGASQAPLQMPDAIETGNTNSARVDSNTILNANSSCGWDIIGGNSWQSWTYEAFAGEIFYVEMEGIGTSDLDLYVFDAYGNLIVSDLRLDDYGHVWVESFRNQTFTIVVENLGSRTNEYDICID